MQKLSADNCVSQFISDESSDLENYLNVHDSDERTSDIVPEWRKVIIYVLGEKVGEEPGHNCVSIVLN